MFNDKPTRIVIDISILIFIALISIFIINTINNNTSQLTNEKDEPILSLTTDSNIFKVDSVHIYSSANALNNMEMQKDYWDLNIYQFSDIAIDIDNHVSLEDLSLKNTVKEIYIDNISYPKYPYKGTPRLYYKTPAYLGIGVINEEKLISDNIYFNVIDKNVDVKEPSFYADCSNPIVLSSINQDIVPHFVVRNTKSAITFDGNLLMDSYILLSNIEYSLSFSIHIINNLDEEYICNLVIPIKLSDGKEINTIYDGSYQVVLSEIPSGKFYKREK